MKLRTKVICINNIANDGHILNELQIGKTYTLESFYDSFINGKRLYKLKETRITYYSYRFIPKHIYDFDKKLTKLINE